MNFLVFILSFVLILNLISCNKEISSQETINNPKIIDSKLNSAETKNDQGGYKNLELKEQKGIKEEFHKQNEYKKKEEAQGIKSAGLKASQDNLLKEEKKTNLNEKKRDELGHDEGKKEASKTKKLGDELKENWDRGSGYIKQWNWDKGTKNKNGYHHENEGNLKKYNKAYKANNGEINKGKYSNYKKHNSDYKNGYDNNKWGHNKNAYGHDAKHGGNHVNNYYGKKKVDEYHEGGWNNEKGWGWGENDDNGHKTKYSWNF